MKISFDERDIQNIYDFEYYLKERNSSIYESEYDLLHQKALELKVIDILEDYSNKSVIFTFQNIYAKPFFCVANIIPTKELPRRRKLKKSASDIRSLVTCYSYLKERNFLINTREYLEMVKRINKMEENWRIGMWRIEKYEWINPLLHWKELYSACGIEILNQTSGAVILSFEKEKKIARIRTHVMKYNSYAQERRKDYV